MTRDGLLFEIEDRTAVLQVWSLPRRFVAMRWPKRAVGGMVRSITIAWRYPEGGA